jgi:hypothetical protein
VQAAEAWLMARSIPARENAVKIFMYVSICGDSQFGDNGGIAGNAYFALQKTMPVTCCVLVHACRHALREISERAFFDTKAVCIFRGAIALKSSHLVRRTLPLCFVFLPEPSGVFVRLFLKGIDGNLKQL